MNLVYIRETMIGIKSRLNFSRCNPLVVRLFNKKEIGKFRTDQEAQRLVNSKYFDKLYELFFGEPFKFSDFYQISTIQNCKTTFHSNLVYLQTQ